MVPNSGQFGLVETELLTSTKLLYGGDGLPVCGSWYLKPPPKSTQPGHPLWTGAVSIGDGFNHC